MKFIRPTLLSSFLSTTCFLLFNLLFNFSASAQIQSYQAQVVSGPSQCMQYMSVKIFNGPIADVATVKIIWFWDGNYSSALNTVQEVAVGPGDSTVVVMSYDLRSITDHQAMVIVESEATGTGVGTNTPVPVIINDTYSMVTDCGRIKVQTWFSGIDIKYPLDFVSGTDTTTLMADPDGFYRGLNIFKDYLVTPSQTWMDNHGYYQQTPEDITDIYFDTDTITPEVNFHGEQSYTPLYVLCGLNCHRLEINSENQTNGAIYTDAVFDYTDPDGVVRTYIANGETQYFPGPENGPFTFSFNDQWLLDNGLAQSGSDFTVDFSLSSNIVQTAYVTCLPTASETDFRFSYAFADDFVAAFESGTIFFEVCNSACEDTLVNARVKLVFPSILVPVTTYLLNPLVNGDTLEFDLYQWSSCVFTELTFTFPGNTLPGTPLHFYATVSDPDGNEVVFSNNTTDFDGIVLNGYDPNVKHSNKPLNINPAEAEVIQYDIHFQNEGNFMAIRVVVEDTISPLMDLSTFRLTGSKHPVTYTIDVPNRVIKFTFEDVCLAPKELNEEASKGYVVYSMKENAGLPVGSEIQNTAYIYFDFNDAIVTNTTSNINQLPSSSGMDETGLPAVTMYPNPAGNKINIQVNGPAETSICDFSGKLLLTSDQKEINIGTLSDGVYLVKVHTPQGMVTKKLLIRK